MFCSTARQRLHTGKICSENSNNCMWGRQRCAIYKYVCGKMELNICQGKIGQNQMTWTLTGWIRLIQINSNKWFILLWWSSLKGFCFHLEETFRGCAKHADTGVAFLRRPGSWPRRSGSVSARRWRCWSACSTPTSSASTTPGSRRWKASNASSWWRNWWRPARSKREHLPAI